MRPFLLHKKARKDAGTKPKEPFCFGEILSEVHTQDCIAVVKVSTK